MRKNHVSMLTVGLVVVTVIMFCAAFVVKSVAMTIPALPTLPPPGISTDPATVKIVPYEVAYSGKYTCLPKVGSTGPQTTECMYGLELGDGEYIALSMDSMTNVKDKAAIRSNSYIRVLGTFVPIEMISTGIWQKYPVSGILQVKEVEKL